jgi:hypothetical protein
MNSRERFSMILDGQLPPDRLPMVEWAPWWDDTIDRWKTEGLMVPEKKNYLELQESFGLDPMLCIKASTRSGECPDPPSYGAPIIQDEGDYEAIRPYLFREESIDNLVEQANKYQESHERGDLIIRLWLDGFFWFPRQLFGIEKHLFAFYDQPDLMHRMNAELADFNVQAFKALISVLKPDMVGFAEDMSYNHGPMLSEGLFDKFLLPYYQQVVPEIKYRGVPVLVDSDGDITSMIPWLQRAGIDGGYPLERQAGVDVGQIRDVYPDFLMMGGYDKMVLSKGKAAIREEFERLLPVMRSGRYVPSVDHQTPPEVSLKNYQIYLGLFEEYAQKAVS